MNLLTLLFFVSNQRMVVGGCCGFVGIRIASSCILFSSYVALRRMGIFFGGAGRVG